MYIEEKQDSQRHHLEILSKCEIYVNLDNVLDEDYEEVFGYQTLGFGASMGLRYSL